jgi:hypothetical protein
LGKTYAHIIITVFFDNIVLLLTKNQQMEKAFSKPHLGAFFAPQKTRLCGGSAACAAAPRPFNPLRTSTHPKGWIIRMADNLAADFELIRSEGVHSRPFRAL